MSSRFGSSPVSVVPAGLGPASRELDARYLTRRTESWFDPGVRRRGADYFRSGEVTSCRGDDRALAATVSGSQTYQVVVEVRGPDQLGVACSCPYLAGQSGFCKHLWAVLLQAEQRGLLRQVGGGSSVIELVDSNRLQRNHEARVDQESAEPRVIVMAPRAPEAQSALGIGTVQPKKPTTWRELLGDPTFPQHTTPAPSDFPRMVLSYVLGAKSEDHLWVELWSHGPVPVGSTPHGPRRSVTFRHEWLSALSEPVDREMFLLLGLGEEASVVWSARPSSLSAPSTVRIPRANAADLVRRLCATGRCHLGAKAATLGPPLVWVGEEPWRLELELTESPIDAAGERGTGALPHSAPYVLRGLLVRGAEKRPVQEADFLGCGVVVWGNAAGAYSAEHGSWLEPLSQTGTLSVLPDEFGAFIRRYHQTGSAPRLDLPPSLALTKQACEPEFVLDVLAPDSITQGLPCQASVRYGEQRVSLDARGTQVVDFEARAIYPRVLEAEQQAKTLLTRLGFRGGVLEVPAGYPCWGPDELRLAKSRLPAAVEALVSAGWRVLAQGKAYRRAGSLAIAVTTGPDWLELEGGASFEGRYVALPDLLRALARKERTVLLDDGTLGLLPEEWLERWGMVADLTDPKGMGRGTDHGVGSAVRLRRAHVCLLDALLETVQEATWDDAFAALRDELRGFRELEPARAPASFVGALRPYQSEGLAWLEFIARLGFGGCLADDMGLGKTIQVLALLLKRQTTRRSHASQTPRSQRPPTPSLIIVPRSLVHNWIEEARRFAPSLGFFSHVGSARDQDLRTLQGHDVLVTSYGTLLRDLEQLQQIQFDCVVLDEAQAIKTAGTQTAKAVRLLRGKVRLALTGTPVENHLGELWSLFDFLNPGLFGAATASKRSTTRTAEGRTAEGRTAEGESRELLRRTIRPFIMRRTKAAVAKDLPPRSEETLWIELDRDERRGYDDLLAYYQATVEKRVVAAGMQRATPLLLEALLRLRQAACHPGLLDPDRRRDPSAKLEVLLEHLQRLREEGHKALVFSQFTSLLAIVRERLQALSVPYEYLDGKTRDRPTRVAHFQNDPTVCHFLISLKAGGLGLNLTAADYVFILDPWWNPAVEAQAIDRSHRIGQSRHVFAYRLIARNTVEERVAELQRRKRKLVEAILGEKSGLAGKLTRKDLEFLLG